MSDKKHIDRLFQEKFKDFEVKPNANVWDNIQNKIEQPKEETKTKFPIWLRLVGAAAAALILLFAVGNLLFTNKSIENTNTTVIDTNNNTKNLHKVKTTANKSVASKNKKNIDNEVSNENKLKNNTVVTSNKISLDNNTSKINKERSNNLSSQLHNTENNSKESNNTSLANKNNANNNRNNIADNSEKENIKNSLSNTQEYTQNNTLKNKNNTTYNINKTNFNNSNTATKNIVVNSNNSKNTTTNNTRVADNKNEINTKALDGLENNIATSNTTVASTDSEKEKEKMVDSDSANTSNTIEEALAKNEALDEEEKENVNRWSVNANIAPVYYNTLGKGSHIHDQFIDNPKNGEINTSYGINVGYALNNKLKIRSGINKLNLSYDTANVIIYENVSTTPNSSPLRNINFAPTSNGQNISVLSTNSFSVQQISGVINNNLNAALSQRLSYVEVPLELEYTVARKRFGLNLIGGFSTFFLNDNEVVTEVEGRKTKIGEANNINNVSFSANAGIGIDYKFNNTVKFSFTPTFKYQINAYNETSGNFKPYIIGVYTGISYKF
ncbi:hypothetical protein [Lacinutrix algicola]|uniref:hypothetical protein n=1 Tax=Lacinutrix algicola TaxID=342954 RepID=UPI0006E3C45E|nr:hypothetical protein [Lacinutrix algicola]